MVEAWQLTWQQAGTGNGTINRRCNTLRRAFNLARRAGKLFVVPYIPRLDEPSRRARYLSTTDAATLDDHLPPYLRLVFAFAYEHGTRKGQLTRTLRRFVDLDRGDDGGFIAPNAGEAKCEAVEAKLLDKDIGCFQKCHGKRAKGHVDATTEGACEADCNALGTVAHVLARLSPNCPEAIGCLELDTRGLPSELGLLPINALVYCDTSSGTPFGGDDTGFVPLHNTLSKSCELKVGTDVTKLALCLVNCHTLRASGMLPDEAAEEMCESTCTTGFTGKVSSLKGCPSCLDGTAIASATESLIDGTYAPVFYCASPSGAFVR